MFSRDAARGGKRGKCMSSMRPNEGGGGGGGKGYGPSWWFQ